MTKRNPARMARLVAMPVLSVPVNKNYLMTVVDAALIYVVLRGESVLGRPSESS